MRRDPEGRTAHSNEVGSRIGQVVAIFVGLGLYYMVISKGVQDISAILMLNPPNFWIELGRYIIANMGGGSL